MSDEKFEEWAIIDLFGHQRMAGKISEISIAGVGFTRIDIPGPDGETLYTRIRHPNAVYGIDPVSREVAIAMAQKITEPPVSRWELKELVEPQTESTNRRRRQWPNDDQDEEDEEEETEPTF